MKVNNFIEVMSSKKTPRTLDVLRKEIDAIDETIFKLLTERFKIVSEVGELKKSDTTGKVKKSIIRPAREALMVSKIYKKALDKKYDNVVSQGIGNLWRMIISTAINLEDKTKIASLADKQNQSYFLAREYFGGFSDIQNFKKFSEILKNLTTHKSNISVVTTQKKYSTKPWWLELSEDESNQFKIFAELPLYNRKSNLIFSEKTFALAAVEIELTGDDKLIYVIENIGKISKNLFKKYGIEVISEYKTAALITVKSSFSDKMAKSISAKNIGNIAII